MASKISVCDEEYNREKMGLKPGFREILLYCRNSLIKAYFSIGLYLRKCVVES